MFRKRQSSSEVFAGVPFGSNTRSPPPLGRITQTYPSLVTISSPTLSLEVRSSPKSIATNVPSAKRTCNGLLLKKFVNHKFPNLSKSTPETPVLGLPPKSPCCMVLLDSFQISTISPSMTSISPSSNEPNITCLGLRGSILTAM